MKKEPKKFGDLVNADHVIAHSADAAGLTGERDALVIVDRYTEYIDAFPLATKSADDAQAALIEYFGTDPAKEVYIWSDSAHELKRAVADMGFAHGRATPGRHQANGFCERTVRKVVEGARTLLEQAGLPQCYWVFALRHLVLYAQHRSHQRRFAVAPPTRPGTVHRSPAALRVHSRLLG